MRKYSRYSWGEKREHNSPGTWPEPWAWRSWRGPLLGHLVVTFPFQFATRIMRLPEPPQWTLQMSIFTQVSFTHMPPYLLNILIYIYSVISLKVPFSRCCDTSQPLHLRLLRQQMARNSVTASQLPARVAPAGKTKGIEVCNILIVTTMHNKRKNFIYKVALSQTL